MAKFNNDERISIIALVDDNLRELGTLINLSGPERAQIDHQQTVMQRIRRKMYKELDIALGKEYNGSDETAKHAKNPARSV